jgi:hypothetical protein
MQSNHISFEKALGAMAPITLEEMDGIKLMNRIDSKYLTNEEMLLKVLDAAAASGYRALVIDGLPLTRYSSVYYDTPLLGMYYAHRNKHLVRQKVRTRAYLDAGQAYLEIKRKNNKGRTSKKRTEIPVSELMDFSADDNAVGYLAKHSWYTVADISPVLSTNFRRITLVNPAMTERLTIDTGLNFENYRTGRKASLEDAVIIELKQDGRAASQMKGILLDYRVKPVRVSKYCVAVTLTDPDARPGRFNLKVRAIEKTIGKKLTVI